MTVFFKVVFPLGHSLEVFAFKFPRPATSGLAYSMIRSFIDFVFGFNGEESVVEKAWLRITSPQQDAELPGQDLLGWLLIPLEGPVSNTGMATADSQVGKGFILSEPHAMGQ